MLEKGGVQCVGRLTAACTAGEAACLGLAATQSMLEKALTFASTAKIGCQIHSVCLWGDFKLMPSANLNQHQTNQRQQHAVC